MVQSMNLSDDLASQVFSLPAQERFTLAQQLLDSILEKRNIREIWLTHLHRDHVSGANHLKKRRNVKIAAHPITARDLAGVVDVWLGCADRSQQQYILAHPREALS